MSAGSPQPVASRGRDDLFDGLPPGLRPREQGSGESSGRRWRLETARAAGRGRVPAGGHDQRPLPPERCQRPPECRPAARWRAYTGHDYQNLAGRTRSCSVRPAGARWCAGTPARARRRRGTQICLLIWGPIVDGRRAVHGGWYLPPQLGGRHASALRLLRPGRLQVLPPVSAAAQPLARAGPRRDAAAELARWWPLAALTLLAAVLRLSTLDLQSFWYDEAFTVVRDLHAGLGSTLHSVVHTENNPPLWYLIAWADSRVLGTGALALRLPSAICGIALVPVAWGIGSELAGRRTATLMAALVAVNPLYVWYSQEARPYGLLRVHGRPGDPLLPARRPRPHARADGAVRAERGAGDAQPLLRRVPGGGDDAVAAAGARRAAARWRPARRRRSCWRASRCCHW